jgi:uncharacterized phage-associated protein/DNA-binding XRE family transcriptional regulator
MTRTTETPDISEIGFQSPAAARRAQLSPEARAFGEQVGRNIDFRNRLRDRRLSLRLTQAEAATIVGEDQGDISRFERGERNPSLHRMEKILARLDAYAEAKQGDVLAQRRHDWTRIPLVSAQVAAQYLCAIRDEEDSFTNLKLQKLLYFAQAYATVLLRRPLFPEKIKAWPHGPVVPQVRYEYKQHQAQTLPRPADFDPSSVIPEARAILDRVYVELGQYEAWVLRERTHTEGPWAGTPQGQEIPLEAIRAFFESRLS